MATLQNIAGTWRTGLYFINVGGAWKQSLVWQNVGGIWKQLSTLFSPDGGTINRTQSDTCQVALTCNTPATWAYSLSNFISADIPSGTQSTQLLLTTTAGGTGGTKFTRSGSASVTAVSNGITRNFTVNLTAEGNA